MALNIAFVDDSRSVLKTIEILLKPKIQSGELALFTFGKPAEFLESIEANDTNFDMLFFDINMPILSGYDLLAKTRTIEQYSKTPIIALTTENSNDAQEKGRVFGFDGWIVKINAPSALVKAIHAAIEKFIPKVHPLELKKAPSDDAMGELQRLFGVIEELNQKLLKAEENKSRFLALMHNEFNNPLFSITMLMKDIIDNPEKPKEDILISIEMIFTDILTLNSQLSNMLAASDVEAGEGIEKILSYFDPVDLIKDIIEMQFMIHKEKHIVLNQSLELSKVIYHDRDKLFLILRNIIENAFEFSPDKTIIDISCEQTSENLEFNISNSGAKVHEKDKMYDAFYMEKSDFSRIHHGLGLGLAVVKYYTGFLNGNVVYTHENNINTFKITIPLNTDTTTELKFDDDKSSGMKF
ncbi:MAG: hypothetical protein RL154_1546 [Pseudomonadota bacterium]